jgi:hypothetical protein
VLFCIMGASASGKSSCLPGLRALFPAIPWYDFHERGVVPPNLPAGRQPSAGLRQNSDSGEAHTMLRAA